MFSVAWGVFATALGWTVATDFRGAAHRFHAFSHAVTPFGDVGAPVVGVGFFRLVAGVFALVGPIVLVGGLMDVWRGEAESDGLPTFPAWIVAVGATTVGALLWTTWHRSGLLRREWAAGSLLRRVGIAGITTAPLAFFVTLGFGWGTWMIASWLAGGLCGLTLLLGDRPGKPSDTELAPADS